MCYLPPLPPRMASMLMFSSRSGNAAAVGRGAQGRRGRGFLHRPASRCNGCCSVSLYVLTTIATVVLRSTHPPLPFLLLKVFCTVAHLLSASTFRRRRHLEDLLSIGDRDHPSNYSFLHHIERTCTILDGLIIETLAMAAYSTHSMHFGIGTWRPRALGVCNTRRSGV